MKITTIKKNSLLYGQDNTYLVVSGSVALYVFDSAHGTFGSIGLYFRNDEVFVPKHCWLDALTESMLSEVDNDTDVLIKQIVDVGAYSLRRHFTPMKETLYGILKKLDDNGISGVNIKSLARVTGYSREITGKRIQELINEGRVIKKGHAHWEII